MGYSPILSPLLLGDGIALVVWLLSHIQLFFDRIHCNPPGSSVHGTSQARVLEWVAISFSEFVDSHFLLFFCRIITRIDILE